MDEAGVYKWVSSWDFYLIYQETFVCIITCIQRPLTVQKENKIDCVQIIVNLLKFFELWLIHGFLFPFQRKLKNPATRREAKSHAI